MYHHRIGSIHLSHCYHTFSWLCAWDACYIIFCHLLHTCSGKTGNCFHNHRAVYDECKNSDAFLLANRTGLFAQYTISLSSLCKLIWRHWIYKMPVRYILSSVWVRLSIFSSLSIIQYVGLYVFSLPISVAMIERIYIYFFLLSSSNRKYELFFTHCLGLGHETMVSAVCLSIFLVIHYTKKINVYLNIFTKNHLPLYET